MQRLRRAALWFSIALLAFALLAGVVVARAYWRVHDKTVLAFHICQNTDLILFSDFGEPPQFAIWLEDPESGTPRTLFVTRRSGTGDWDGKAECPASLPAWFVVYKRETGADSLPTPDAPAADGVTGATPKSEEFAWFAEVEPGSKWICWIEVNISGDYNEAFVELDPETGYMDTDKSGQPSLLYRAEIEAAPGAVVTPELHGHAETGTGRVERELDSITTAKEIFRDIEIRVERPRVKLF